MVKVNKAQQLAELGFEPVGKAKEIVHNGRLVSDQTWKLGKSSLPTRMLAGAEGVATAAISLGIAHAPILNLGSDHEKHRVNTFGVAFGAERHIYTDKKDDLSSFKLIGLGLEPDDPGFNPTDRQSIIDFLKRPEIRRQVCEANGHYYLKIVRRDDQGREISSFLFVPNGDWDKATSIRFWEASSGKSVTDREEGLRYIRSYCAGYNEIKDLLGKKLNEMAEKRVPDSVTGAERQKQVESWVKAFKKHCHSMVFDMRRNEVRFYPDYDMNEFHANSDWFHEDRFMSTKYTTGLCLELSDEMQKNIKRIYGKDMQAKDTLEGDQPFKKKLKDKKDDVELPPNFFPQAPGASAGGRPRSFSTPNISGRQVPSSSSGPTVEEVND